MEVSLRSKDHVLLRWWFTTPVVTPRRWLDQCNPELSALITKTLKLEKAVWLKDLSKLEGLLPFAEDKAFRAEWAAIKQRNKERLAHYVQTSLGLIIRTDAMFDVQIKVSNLRSNWYGRLTPRSLAYSWI